MLRVAMSLVLAAPLLQAAPQPSDAAEIIVEPLRPTYSHLLGLLVARQQGDASATNDQIGQAVRAFRAAIMESGNSRRPIREQLVKMETALNSGTFDAAVELGALEQASRGPGAALYMGNWQPERMPGKPVTRPVGLTIDQRGVGDCVGVSVVRAFAATPTGAQILRRAVKLSADGNYYVNLPGAADKIYRIKNKGLERYGVGDAPASAIIGAFYSYFPLQEGGVALPTNTVMQVLAGRYGVATRFSDSKSSPDEIRQFLLAAAPEVGSSRAMVFGGAVGKDATWARGDGHAFAIIKIDAAKGQVIYTNPWNQRRIHTIAIDELATQASGTSANFASVKFS